MTLDNPPVAMLQNDLPAGLEYDFAVALSRELGRPLEIVELAWNQQLDFLVTGKIDIIMSGMSITPARMVRVAFCDSYMRDPLVAVTRRGEAGQYASAEEVLQSTLNIGVIRQTTSDAFARRNLLAGKIIPMVEREDVAFTLSNQRIDLFIDDFSAAMELVSRHETRLEIIPHILHEQELAWALRPEDEVLREKVNAILARWRGDGTLERMLNHRLPYRRVWLEAYNE
jgi:polar amino acid transport system substrate-binding protein